VNYVDVCDDLDPTQVMLKLDDRARERGVKALIGMGSSPGLANVFVRLCADMFLDTVVGADIMHIHGGESTEGAAVLKHRIHAMVNDVPLYLDGKFVDVRQLEKSGEDHVEEVDFVGVGRYPVYVYPHPETITLPTHIPELKRATNKGVIFPLSYFRLTQDMVRVGACTSKPVLVGDKEVVPLDFSVAHIQTRRSDLLREAGVTGPAGCLKVVVEGLRRQEKRTMVLQLSSKSEGAGPGTGIPAAIGAILMAQGQIDRHGVFPPEAAVPPMAMLSMANQAFGRLPKASNSSTKGDNAADIRLEQVNADGTIVDLTQQFSSKL
jgi:saccharopine dehydrogenase (NAD+, L-lysine-forming)